MKIEKVKSKDIIKDRMEEIYLKEDKKRGVDINFKPFAYGIKNDDGEIMGGIHGWRAFNEVYVDELCIDESTRGCGYGRKLLDIVETEVCDETCDNINLVTNKFQEAIDFYKKCGFTIEHIRRNDKNPKMNKYYMVKKLK